MTRLLVYAGPNGSGKSSLRDSVHGTDAVTVLIDPDRIARTINPGDLRAADRAAGEEALLLFQATLDARHSMSLETTLAGHSILRRLRSAKGVGYEVDLRYVALDAVTLNIDRVQARATKGGHFIAPDDIRRRYASSLANLPRALEIVDRAILADNSGENPRPVLEIVARRIVRVSPDLPSWVVLLMPEIRAICSNG